jgi:hypothetical protein
MQEHMDINKQIHDYGMWREREKYRRRRGVCRGKEGSWGGGGCEGGVRYFIGEKRTERRSLRFEELSWEGERKMKRRVRLLFWTKEQRKR